MNGNDELDGGPDLESNEPDPKRARIDPEISNEIDRVTQENDIAENHEKERVKNLDDANDELGLFKIST